jgi:hypothetical protein
MDTLHRNTMLGILSYELENYKLDANGDVFEYYGKGKNLRRFVGNIHDGTSEEIE